MKPLLRFFARILPLRRLRAPAVFLARLVRGIAPGLEADAFVSALGYPELGPSVRIENHVALKRSRVSLVTTAGFFVKGDLAFREGPLYGDFTFRVIPRDMPPARLALGKAFLDRRLPLLDPNIVFPIERLKELKAEKVIQEAALYHYSLAAYCGDTDPLVGGSAKEIARRMRYEGVDKAVILPASRLGQEAAVRVQRVIEEAGIPTVSVLYSKAAAEALKPPRCVILENRPLARSEEYLDRETQKELLLKLLRKFEPFGETSPHGEPAALKR